MAQLSNRLQRLAPSATLAMSQKSAEMKAQGIDVINMSVGEPDFNTPERIKQAKNLLSTKTIRAILLFPDIPIYVRPLHANWNARTIYTIHQQRSW